MSERSERVLKALVLLGLGHFLYAKLMDGTLLFYINRRFAWLTFLAALALTALSVVTFRAAAATKNHDHHRHRVTWGTLLLVALPAILGTLIPPVPLGSDALANRSVTTTGLGGAGTGTTTTLVSVPTERDLLDWLQAFGSDPDPAAFAGQEAALIGFVYRDERCHDDQFMLSRFVITCCVADATAVGMVVRWPDAPELAADEWVEVHGTFEAGQFGGETIPVLAADRVRPTEMPNQPYLYP